MYRYISHVTKTEQIDVVEWLKWYRCAINDILSQEKVVAGSGYFDILESEFYSAIHRSYLRVNLHMKVNFLVRPDWIINSIFFHVGPSMIVHAYVTFTYLL